MRRIVFNWMHTALKIGLVLCAVAFVSSAVAGPATAAESNRLKSLTLEKQDDTLEVSISAYSPIGYRYTVYDSQDPRRIVVDFRGMDLDLIPNAGESEI